MKKTRRSYNSTLPAGKPLKRKGKSRFPKRRCKAFREWVSRQPCFFRYKWEHMHECRWWRSPEDGSDPAHVTRSQGAGADDVGAILPFCHPLHEEWHQHGRHTFCKKYRVTLEHLAENAAYYGRLWREQQGETAA